MRCVKGNSFIICLYIDANQLFTAGGTTCIAIPSRPGEYYIFFKEFILGSIFSSALLIFFSFPTLKKTQFILQWMERLWNIFIMWINWYENLSKNRCFKVVEICIYFKVRQWMFYPIDS